ncbi:MAG: hypothetical protein ACT4PZ_21745 [Panacagrimonas sp.]
MDLTTAPLIFEETQVGAAFGVALSLGLMLVGGWFLLRRWPPRASRVLLALGLAVACCGVAAWFLRMHQVLIDPARQEVVERTQVLGWGSKRVLPLASVQSVFVQRMPVRFAVGLDVPEGWLVLDEFDDVTLAENTALSVSQSAKRPAVRRGYRIESGVGVSDPQDFETAQGRKGVALSLERVVRVIDASGDERIR